MEMLKCRRWVLVPKIILFWLRRIEIPINRNYMLWLHFPFWYFFSSSSFLSPLLPFSSHSISLSLHSSSPITASATNKFHSIGRKVHDSSDKYFLSSTFFRIQYSISQLDYQSIDDSCIYDHLSSNHYPQWRYHFHARPYNFCLSSLFQDIVDTHHNHEKCGSRVS